MNYLLDTHALVWWVAAPEELSRRAASAIDKAIAAEGPLFASSISIWEIGTLLRKGRLSMPVSFADWVRAVESIPLLRFAPLSNAIAVDSVQLPDFDHADPADRLIVATARHLDATLLTKDAILRKYRHVRSLW